MGFVETLADRIEKVVSAGIENGSINRDTVAQIIVGPSRHFGSLLLWFHDSWQSYSDCSGEDGFGEIPCFEWLERIDSVFPGKNRSHAAALGRAAKPERQYHFATQVAFLDEGLNADYQNELQWIANEIVDSLKMVIDRQNLGQFSKVVGFMVQGLSRSRHADPVGFYHPEGATVLAIDESRSGGEELDGFGAFTTDGIRMFYPEVKADEAKGNQQTHKYLFSDMLYWTKEPDDRKLRFRLKTDSFDIGLEPGYTLEEWCWQTTEGIRDAIEAHFSQVPQLRKKDGPPKLDGAEEDMRQWLRTNKPMPVFEDLLAQGRIADAERLYRYLPDDSGWRGRICYLFANACAVRNEHQKALDLLNPLTGQAANYCIDAKFRALTGLERYHEIIDWCTSLIAKKNEDDDLPLYIAVAYALSGDLEQSLAQLEKLKEKKKEGGLALMARAIVLDERDDPLAISLLERAVLADWKIKKYGHLYLQRLPRLQAVIDSMLTEDKQNKEDGERLATIGSEIGVQTIPLNTAELRRKSYFSDTEKTISQWQAVGPRYGVEKLIDGKIKRFLRDEEGRIWGLAQTRGLVPIQLDAGGTLTVGAPVLSTGSLEDGVIQGRWLFAADYRNGLSVFDLGGTSAKHMGTVPGRSGMNAAIAVEGNLAVLLSGDQVEVFDVSDPVQPRRRSTIGLGHGPGEGAGVKDIALKDGVLYACGRPFALTIVDLKDPAHPEIVSATKMNREDSPDWFSADSLQILADKSVLIADNARGLWHVDVSDLRHPRSLVYYMNDAEDNHNNLTIIHLAHSREDGYEYWAMDDDVNLVWKLCLRPGKPIEVLGVTPTLSAKGEPETSYYVADFCVLSEDQYLVFGDHYFGVCRRVQTPSVTTDGLSAIHRSAPAVTSWIRESLKEFGKSRPGVPVGVVFLTPTGEDQISLGFAPQQTISTVEDSFAMFRETDGDEEGGEEREGEELPRYDFKVPGIESMGEGDAARQEALTHALRSAYQQLIRKVLSDLGPSSELSDVAGGRAYLIEIADARRTVVACREFPDRSWNPWRPEIEGVQQISLADKLEDYKSRDAITQQVRKDRTLYAELVGLAKAGHAYALSMLWANRDLEPESVTEILMDALNAPSTRSFAARCLLEEQKVPKIHARLMQLWNSLPAALHEADSRGAVGLTHEGDLGLTLARGLQLFDEDRVYGLVEALALKSGLRYYDLDAICDACEMLRDRIGGLRQALLGIVERLGEDDNRMAGICEQLFRSGHRELPTKLLKQSRRNKDGEQYSDVKMGIPALDEGADSQYAEPRVERLFTGWMLAGRIHQLVHEDCSDESVWPASLPHEPYPASWAHVLTAAMPHIVERQEVDAFIDLLGKRSKKQKTFHPDQRFLLHLFDYALEQKNEEQTGKIHRLILESPAYDAGVKKKIGVKATFSELATGWELLKAERLLEARQIADRLLALDVEMETNTDFAQIYFFDARLKWKEHKSPQAAIDSAEAYLKKLDQTTVGSSRLCNLIGCALDEMGQVAEALPYFEKAAKHSDQDPMYMGNMAEAYEKLGRIPEAVRCATEVLRRNHTSAVCERIVQQYGKSTPQ